MEYQVTVVSTYWVKAENREDAIRAVKAGRVQPDSVDIESA